MDIAVSLIKPIYSPARIPDDEPSVVQQTIDTLGLQPHPEGGFYIRTDRNPVRVPNTFQDSSSAPEDDQTNTTRAASSSIFYFITPRSPLGVFHRNRARTVHTLHRGRARYVIIHADEVENHQQKARIESFVVGQNLAAGEKLQWIVPGGKYKGCYLLPDEENGSSEGLLISEVVVPGFEFCDHDFLRQDDLGRLVMPEQAQELSWMLRKTSDST